MNLSGKMKAKPWVLWMLSTAVAGIAVYALAQPLTVAYLAQRPINVTPFAISLEGTDYKWEASGHHFMSEFVGRRTDGALVSSHVAFGLDGKEGVKTRKLSFPDGTVISVSDTVSSYIRWPKR